MKIIILCGGTGTRMKEETEFRPKPLVQVGGKPMLWHIMKIYSHYGYNDFILTLGYKGDMIKQHFLNWQSYTNDFTLDTKNNQLTFHNNDCDDFKITFVETGLKSLTGERIRRVKKYIGNEDFMVTYGDGVADIDIKKLVDFHKNQNTLATITGVQPSSKFGLLSIDHDTSKIVDFQQKLVKDFDKKIDASDYINGGFMVFKNKVLDILPKDSMIEHIFHPLTKDNELSVYKHSGKWRCMDTQKEVKELNEFWEKDPFWKIW